MIMEQDGEVKTVYNSNNVVIWTDDLKEEFVRKRKEYEHLFTRGRNTSLQGWTHVLESMGLGGVVSPQQAKKRWENFIQRYRMLKKTVELGMSDAPITWKLYHLMEWACGSGMSPSEELENGNEQSSEWMEHPEGIPVVTELAENSLNSNIQINASPPITRQGKYQTPRIVYRLHRFQPKPKTAADNPNRMSVHRAVGALLDAAEEHQVDAINSLRSSLNELTALQREVLQSQRAQQEISERLANAAERQATALEQLVNVLSNRFSSGPTIPTSSSDIKFEASDINDTNFL